MAIKISDKEDAKKRKKRENLRNQNRNSDPTPEQMEDSSDTVNRSPFQNEDSRDESKPRVRARISNVEEGGKRKKRGRKYRNQRRGGPVDTPLELDVVKEGDKPQKQEDFLTFSGTNANVAKDNTFHEETNSDYDPSPRRRARISTVAEGEKRKKKKASKFSKNKMKESEHTSDEFILSDTTTVSGNLRENQLNDETVMTDSQASQDSEAYSSNRRNRINVVSEGGKKKKPSKGRKFKNAQKQEFQSSTANSSEQSASGDSVITEALPTEPARRRAKIVKVEGGRKKSGGSGLFSGISRKGSKSSDSSESLELKKEMEVLKNLKKKKKSNMAEEARKRIEIAKEITLPKNIESIEKYSIIPGVVNVEIIWNKDMLESIYVVTEPELEFEETEYLARIEADMEQVIRSLKTLPDDLSTISIEKIASNYLTGRKSVYSLKTIENLKYYIGRDYEGYGPLDAIIRDPMVEDISCNGVGVPIFIEHKIHGSLKTNIVFESDEQLDSYVVRLAQLCGKEVSMNEPIVDGTFPQGHRIQITYGKEISAKGSSFTFRLFRETPFTPIELIKYGAATSEVVTYLWFAVENLKSAIIAGVPGVGKTSTINAMLMFIPPNTKVFSIEETREINILHQNWVATSTRESIYSSGTDSKNPPIGMFELVRMAMRQRPTYIVLGEIRGRESYSLFQAISTGHTAYSTIHADSMETLINRLETNPLNIPRVLISSLDFVVFNKFIRMGSRSYRKITEIDEIMGIDPDSGEILYNRVFGFDFTENRQLYSQYSRLLKEVRESKQMSEEDFQKEFSQRKKLIENMVQNGINDYERITKVINIFYKDKESAFKLTGGEL